MPRQLIMSITKIISITVQTAGYRDLATASLFGDVSDGAAAAGGIQDDIIGIRCEEHSPAKSGFANDLSDLAIKPASR